MEFEIFLSFITFYNNNSNNINPRLSSDTVTLSDNFYIQIESTKIYIK